MDREIVIYKGDEHRAKMEKQFYRKDIFADVYGRAYKLLTEIEQEMEAYREEIIKNKNRLIRYQGMGNNVIIFCGGRGQGKTSAMQSFAKCLDGTYADDRAGKDSDRLGFVSQIDAKVREKRRYEVVDSIDPSAMESGESILGVLISRLFFRLEEYIKSDDCPSKDDNTFLQDKREIVKLFEKCYQNIGCIKSGKEAGCARDDLQELSQMGSSARLKENLYDLIQKYLVMKTGGKNCARNETRYLIIPIDDADLMTKKIFRLCEDIRNYLSIPNVIILMAVDYEQLFYAIYQKYLKQYRVMMDIGSDKAFYEECHRMAAKYLEKVFPVIHRIDLPRLDSVLAEGQSRIRFDYKIKTGAREYESAFHDVDISQCNNLQEQVIKILYSRTGMIFRRQDQSVHFFMPHTLRELTHWVKLLYDMHELDCDRDVYRKFQCLEELDDSMLDKLKENIQAVKQYFVNYWCEKYLDSLTAGIFQKLDNAGIRRAQKASGDCWDQAPAAARKVCQSVMESLSDENLIQNKSFIEAVFIDTTIVLNEWFATALSDCIRLGESTHFFKIADFVEEAVDLSGYCGKDNRYKGRYRTMRFNVSRKALREIIKSGGSTKAIGSSLNDFCTLRRRTKLPIGQRISDNGNWEKVKEADYRTLEFDIFKPILARLRESNFIIDRTDTAGEQETTRNKETKGGRNAFRAPYLVTVRNILANCDVQVQMKEIINSWYEENNEDKKTLSLVEQIPKMLVAIYEHLAVSQEGSEDTILGIYDMADAKYQDMINIMFLCNKDNFQSYIEEKSKELTDCRDLVQDMEKNINNMIQSEDQERTAELQDQIEKAMYEVEDGLGKVWIDEDLLQPIAESFHLEGYSKVDVLTDAAFDLRLSRYSLEEDKMKLEKNSSNDSAAQESSAEDTQEE